jgi:hypothetical protein
MLLGLIASLMRTVSLSNELVPFIVTEPLENMTVPPLKVQLVQEILEFTVRTTPGLRLIVQPLQEDSEPKAVVVSLAVILYVWALPARLEAINDVMAIRRVSKDLIGFGSLLF